MKPRHTAALLCLCALLAGSCRTVRTTRPVFRSHPPVRISEAARMYAIGAPEEAQGYVVHFASDAASVWVVRNRYHQDLGVIDALGRAYRYQPHVDGPVWVGSGSVLRGVQRILAMDARPALTEVPMYDPEALTAGVPLEAMEREDLLETDAP